MSVKGGVTALFSEKVKTGIPNRICGCVLEIAAIVQSKSTGCA
jgi:hypothetical protein